MLHWHRKTYQHVYWAFFILVLLVASHGVFAAMGRPGLPFGHEIAGAETGNAAGTAATVEAERDGVRAPRRALDAAQPAPAGPPLPERVAPRPLRQIVINIPALTLYLFDSGRLYKSYPVAVGRRFTLIGERLVPSETPVGEFRVSWKDARPAWHPPDWLKKEKGWPRDYSVPPGPDNPLGTRWIGIWRPGVEGYGIHGTNDPASIGNLVSLGCIRMRNSDVEELFDLVEVGTPVSIIYEPGYVYRDASGRWHVTISPDVYQHGIDPLSAAREQLAAAGLDPSVLNGEAPSASGASRDIALVAPAEAVFTVRVNWPEGFGSTSAAYREGDRIMVALSGFPPEFQRYFQRGDGDGMVWLYGRPITTVTGPDMRTYVPLDEAAARFGVRVEFEPLAMVAHVTF